jgi:hypothetical protein
VTPALGISIAILVPERTLPADVAGDSRLGDAEAFLFLDGFISAIFLVRQTSIPAAQYYAQ